MPRRCKIEPIKTIEDRAKPWKIELPASLSPSGKRQRFFFETKKDASSFAEEQKVRKENFGSHGLTRLSPSELEQCAKALEDIKPFKVSLNEVVSDWIARRRARETTVTFTSAFDHYLDHLKTKRVKGRPVSESYQTQIKLTYPRFPSLHTLPLTDIDAKAISRDMIAMTPSVKNSFLRVLGAFFTWCAEPPREWVRGDNPASKVPRESVGSGEVKVYTPDEAIRLLEASPDDLKPYFLFGLFAGIRPEELERLDWKHINIIERYIELPGAITKTGARRVVTIDPTLENWLLWHQSKNGIQTGLVTPLKNLRRRLRTTRETAKVATIQDGMRHTYASMWLAVYKDEHRLRENLGHKSADELWNHYFKACTEKEARQFWDIMPPASDKIFKFENESVS